MEDAVQERRKCIFQKLEGKNNWKEQKDMEEKH
jgi:hypothetical protein